MLSATAEQETPPWMQPHAELLLRPLELADSYDPEHPHELDDAVSVEDLSSSSKAEFRVKIHIPDTSAFVDQPFMVEAIKRGWSKYYDDGRCDPLFPNKVIRTTSLETGSPDVGVPATTLAYTVVQGSPELNDVDFYKSRVIGQPHSYKYLAQSATRSLFDPERNPQQALLYRATALERTAGEASSLEEAIALFGANGSRATVRSAERVIGNQMFTYNRLMPSFARRFNVPILFRNHNLGSFLTPKANLIQTIYPDSEIFAKLGLAWYGRVSAGHEGVGQTDYCHASSPLRRVPDTLNSANLVAGLDGKKAPYPEAFLDEVSTRLATKIKRALGFSALAA